MCLMKRMKGNSSCFVGNLSKTAVSEATIVSLAGRSGIILIFQDGGSVIIMQYRVLLDR